MLNRIGVIGGVVTLFALTSSWHCFAYKVEVHAAMTENAVRRSVLGSWNFRIKTFRTGRSGFPITYYHPESKENWSGDSDIDNGDSIHIGRLMAFGADIEDTGLHVENLSSLYVSRAFNHFYNPQANKKYPLLGLVDNHTSKDWATESGGISIEGQNFSYRDAQEWYFKAMTAYTENDRDRYLGKMIQTLGHVVHHIQDMAQPQHTRVDSHCDAAACEKLDNFGVDRNDTSFYEVYTRDLKYCGEGNTGYGLFGAYAKADVPPETLHCDAGKIASWAASWTTKTIALNSYPVVDAKLLVDGVEPKETDFWHNVKGSGMADFSSEHFISTDTAFSLNPCEELSSCTLVDGLMSGNSEDLPLPDGAVTTTHSDFDVTQTYISSPIKLKELIELPSQVPNGFGDGLVQFVGIEFTDKLSNETVRNDRMASYSVFNERLTRYASVVDSFIPATMPILPVLTKNIFTLDSQAAILMPRAVAYSAGIINFFFRHKIEAAIDIVAVEGSGGSSAKHRLSFTVENAGEYDMPGIIQVYAKTISGLVQIFRTTKTIKAGESYSNDFYKTLTETGDRDFIITVSNPGFSDQLLVSDYLDDVNVPEPVATPTPAPVPTSTPEPSEPIIYCENELYVRQTNEELPFSQWVFEGILPAQGSGRNGRVSDNSFTIKVGNQPALIRFVFAHGGANNQISIQDQYGTEVWFSDGNYSIGGGYESRSCGACFQSLSDGYLYGTVVTESSPGDLPGILPYSESWGLGLWCGG